MSGANVTDITLVKGKQAILSAPEGTPPLEVVSTTKVANLNADLLDGQSADAFAPAGHNHDDRYYTDAEVNLLLAGKSDTGHTHTNLPSSGEKAALAGTSGTPGAANKYVTNGDTRLSDARTPTAHTHDDRYYTESEVDALIAASETGAVPLVVAYRSTNLALASGTWTDLLFNATYLNKGTAYNAATGVFTAPQAAAYRITARANNNNSSNTHLRTMVGGVVQEVFGSFPWNFLAVMVVYVAAGAQIKMQVYTNDTQVVAGIQNCALVIEQLT